MRINPLVTALGLLGLFAASMLIGYLGGQLFLAPAKSAPRTPRGTTPPPVVVENPPTPAAPLGPSRQPDVPAPSTAQPPAAPTTQSPALTPSAPKPVPPKPTASAPQGQTGVAFRVQAGAYQHKENADARIAQLRQDGYEPYIVTSGSLYRVIVGAFNDRDNAEKLLAELHGKGYDALILSVR